MEERRQGGRCPTCQGPMRTDVESGQERCRNSLCPFNHRGVKCPRCGAEDIEATGRSLERFDYTCQDCQHRFKATPK